MKKIVLATTLMKNEDPSIFMNNIKIISNKNYQVIPVINTQQDLPINNSYIINKVNDLVDSRLALIQCISTIKADAYFVLDPDLEFDSSINIDFIISHKKDFDLLNLCYYGDFTLPSFFSLASSLNDLSNSLNVSNTNRKITIHEDDMDINSSLYASFNYIEKYHNIDALQSGKAFMRKLIPNIEKVNPKGLTSGGATCYLNLESIQPNIVTAWPKYKGKALKWFDTFRITQISKNFRYKKLPIFLKHNRFNKNLSLCWDEVIRCIQGLNIIQKHKYCQANIEHIIHLYFFQKGKIKKIISQDESINLDNIIKFLNIDINKIVKEIKERCKHHD